MVKRFGPGVRPVTAAMSEAPLAVLPSLCIFYKKEVEIKQGFEPCSIRSISCEDFQPFRARASLVVWEQSEWEGENR